MKRILITGASGFVGTHLARYLQTVTDWELWSFGRDPHPALPSVTADILDREAVMQVVSDVRPDMIVHLAAQAFVPAAFADPAGTFNINVLGQLNLFQAIVAAQINPIFLSVISNAIYGMAQATGQPANEQTPLQPTDPYAVSKAAQDLMAGQWFYSHKLNVIRARPFNHIGPGQRPDFVVPAFARQIARIELGLQEPIIRVGNLEPQRDFSDVRDIVRAYHLILERGNAGDVFNIGSGRTVSIGAILNQLIALSGHDITVDVDAAKLRPVEVPIVACDASHLRERTGWQPQFTLEQTLSDILHDWRTITRLEAEGERR